MERLPQEVVDQIIEEVAQDLDHHRASKLAEFAVVSRAWQRAIERRLFATIHRAGV